MSWGGLHVLQDNDCAATPSRRREAHSGFGCRDLQDEVSDTVNPSSKDSAAQDEPKQGKGEYTVHPYYRLKEHSKEQIVTCSFSTSNTNFPIFVFIPQQWQPPGPRIEYSQLKRQDLVRRFELAKRCDPLGVYKTFSSAPITCNETICTFHQQKPESVTWTTDVPARPIFACVISKAQRSPQTKGGEAEHSIETDKFTPLLFCPPESGTLGLNTRTATVLRASIGIYIS
ncbi:hypothetical protein BDZ45DRAFT_690445 [Acephala macrosclerotiorum]|nr:hypothetical protein BDZ45DRAFT_690445 [Acephala macrosclerotiorum]